MFLLLDDLLAVHDDDAAVVLADALTGQIIYLAILDGLSVLQLNAGVAGELICGDVLQARNAEVLQHIAVELHFLTEVVGVVLQVQGCSLLSSVLTGGEESSHPAW